MAKSAAAPRTGQKDLCPILGLPVDLLPDADPPTMGQVLRCYQFTLNDLKCKNKMEPQRSTLMKLITPKILSIWNLKYPNCDLLSERQITRLLEKSLNEYANIIKLHRRNQKPKKYDSSLKGFLDDCNNIFDIQVCKCKKPKCDCKQYTPRHCKTNTETAENQGSSSDMNMDYDEAQENNHDQQDPTYVIPENAEVEQNRLDLFHFATVCDRFGIPDRAAAALASALLVDVGLIREHDVSNIIDRSKVRREREKARKTLLEKNRVTEPESLYFDGRKDLTMKFEKNAMGRWRRMKIKEEHITIIAEPDSRFLGHSTPISGHAASVSNSILDHLQSKNISLEKTSSIGCDGTSVNTGHKGGVIRLLEVKLQKPLQWFICLLHFNELLMKHIMEHVDGPTNGPRAYKGTIGQLLPDCHLLPVVDFDFISVELPPLSTPDLSTDQCYLLRMAHAVTTGNVPPDLSELKPGPLNHARWLTLACRILRLYVATEVPGENLKTLATFVMRVYVPQWFQIKRRPSCTEGARHIFQAIQRSRYLPRPLIGVIDKVIQTNAYFAHHENILLAMLFDDLKEIRLEAASIIIGARNHQQSASGKLRRFRVPTINFNATSYRSMITWPKTCSEPPVLRHFSNDEINEIALTNSKTSVHKLPCHTQAVERGVKIVTEASSSVCGERSREGFIECRSESRKTLPNLDTKKDFLLFFKNLNNE
ncbi:hypothetical protein FOCC_FOCC012785 [Frankliniella occidentalis]|nr:hypothetical protein FOCC_FOCC012785 [Frankliniella occidentalis]